jgi:hypothetical protein
MLLSSRYGSNVYVSERIVKRAWKPVIVDDGLLRASLRKTLRAFKIELSEKRLPIIRQLKNDLDGSFVIRKGSFGAPYHFHRKNSACPDCWPGGRESIGSIIGGGLRYWARRFKMLLLRQSKGGFICDHLPAMDDATIARYSAESGQQMAGQ